ncbi:MAG: FtsK/SpoIIIE domain-containing protein, partial [Trebonia sp.]
LYCERRGVSLPSERPLASAGIRWGDRLVLTPPRRELTRIGEAPMVELSIVGGPNTSAQWTLGAGRYEIGRDAAADVRIADPSLSRRHGVLVVSEGETTITDVGSSNGIAIDGERLGVNAPRRLTAADTVELGRSLVTVRPVGDAGETASDVPEHGGLVRFNRQPRVADPRKPVRLELAAPPESARRGRLPLAASAVPLVVGVVMFVVMNSPMMLVIAALSPIMAVTNYVVDRRRGAKSFGGGAARFQAETERALSELDAALAREVGERRKASPDVGELIERARSHRADLWERRLHDDDFMKLRIGIADMPAFARLSLAEGGDPKLREPVEVEIAARGTVAGVPVTVNLIEVGSLGLAGPRHTTAPAAASLMIQAACLHSPAALVIAAAVAAGDEWRWMKWLPHLAHDRIGLQRSIAVGRAETTAMLADVRDLIADRRSQRSGQFATSSSTAVLLLLDEDVCTDRALVTSALADSSESRVAVIWLGHRPRDLPGHTGATLVADDVRFAASLTNVNTGEQVADVALDGLDPSLATTAARALCPTRDVGERGRAGDIPQRVSLLELLDLSPVTHAGLIDRWNGWQGELSSTVGAGVDGAVAIDLRADGPHALIAGTTGSGKSELLRTFVVGAAAAVPPHRLNFMLVDYKGGSAFAPCALLPHVVEVVSDLNEHRAERALVALHAELKRREHILADHGARDLLELQRRAPDAAPPMLVIAVDEFAKLREEVPEFVDGVVDIAQRGRSLGVHMVLAAQTLRNAFTPAIRANTNLRIALRVAEDSESADVISSPAAARIPSGERYRGRAFARTGHDELREFQTAYVSGQTVAVSDRAIEVLSLGPNGPELPISAGSSFDSDEHSDLAALARIAIEAGDQIGLARQHAPWLPPLPAELDPGEVPVDGLGSGQAAIGLIDRPHLQRQDPLVIDLPSAGHVIVFGAGGSGKSSVLVTTAFALALNSNPAQLRIYGLDATGGSLTAVEQLPQCGGVIRMDDEERVDRLLRRLLAEIDSPSEQRMVVLLDDLGAFQTIHDKPGSETSWVKLQAVLAGG